MTKRRLFLTCLCGLLWLLGAFPAEAQIERFARVPAAFSRDQRRLATTPLVKSLADLLKSPSAFSGARPSTGSWQRFTEGASSFAVNLGHGCTLKGSVQRYDFPGVNVTKVKELTLERAGRHVQLLDGALPVNIDLDTAFYYNEKGGHVRWHGPASVFALMALYHELDHLKQYEAMNEKDRAGFRDIYDRKSEAAPLTSEQKRIMVGFERHAWASALAEMRRLKRQGFDLLAGVPHREIRSTIDGCLKHYYDYQGGVSRP